MTDEIVITGLGVVSAAGVGQAPFWEALTAGRSALAEVERLSMTPFAARLGGEIRGLDPADYIAGKRLRYMPESAIYFTVAAQFALEDSGLSVTSEGGLEFGLILSSTFSNIDDIADFHLVAESEGPGLVNPSCFPNILNNAAAGHAAIRLGTMAINCALPNGFTGGLDAIAYAAAALRGGHCRYALVGGAEEINARIFGGFNALGLLAPDAPRPYDQARDGLTLGEGAAVLLMERAETAFERGARVYALVGGYGAGFDPDAFDADVRDGAALARCIGAALERGGLAPRDVDWVCGNANGHPWWDDVEVNALRAVFSDGGPPVSSLKGALGEGVGAAGAWGAAAGVLAVRDGLIPPSVGLETPLDCGLDFVRRARRADVCNVLLTAASCDGHVSALTVSSPGGDV
jgi:3-oxoacyl-[acyl-carrier-protein] synthase II